MRMPTVVAACALAACFPSTPSPAPAPAPAPVVVPAVPAAAGLIPVRIDVALDPFKANGREWDAGGEAPDIAICVASAGLTRCLPSGTSMTSVTEPTCRDSLGCSFTGLTLPPGPFQLQVIDVDALANDLAGQGACQVGAACRIGQAAVTTSDARWATPGAATAGAPGLALPASVLPPGAVPPKAQATIARIRQAIAARDMLALRGLLADDGEYQVGPGLVAETAQAAAEAFRANPALLADLDRVLAMPCASERDDDMTIVTCPAVANDDYAGPVAMLAEEDTDTYFLAGFLRP